MSQRRRVASREPLTTLWAGMHLEPDHVDVGPHPAEITPDTQASPRGSPSLSSPGMPPPTQHLSATDQPMPHPPLHFHQPYIPCHRLAPAPNASTPPPAPFQRPDQAPNTVAPIPVPVQVHAAHCGRVPIQRVHAFARVCVPHFEGPVCGAADDNAVPHLGRPHTPCVANQRLHTLQRTRCETLVWERLNTAKRKSEAQDFLQARDR